MSGSKPTLHHLNNSQSQRILWLLEELEIPYDLKLYERATKGQSKGRAPTELKQIHPLGKSPTLVTAEGRVIVESSVIAQYLIDTYDKTGAFKGNPATGNDAIRDDEFTSIANNSFGVVISLEIFLTLLVSQSPFFIRPLCSGIRGSVRKAFSTGELHSLLTYFNDRLGDQEFIMGSHPGRADFMMSWPMDCLEQWEITDLTKYPKIHAWHQRCHTRAAWKRGLEKGNGYKLPLH